MKILAATAIAAGVLGAAGLALAATPRQQTLIDSTVRFLQESQQAGGGFADPGRTPSQSISAWTALALAGAGINPADQARCGTSALAYLEGHFGESFEEELAWPQVAITAFERELLVVDASAADPHDFGGYDLVAEILGRQLPDGSFPYVPEGATGETNDTIFAVLALSPIHEQAAETAVARAAEWIVAAEGTDGGWYYSGRRETSEVDMTGAALEALVAAGPPAAEPRRAEYEAAITAGLAYLRAAQLPDGGFPALPRSESESNVASTAWAVQGIWATGGNPEAWVDAGREPLDYMESMQQPDGHVRWRASSDLNGIWMTAYVTPAFAGQALPVPPAARLDPRASEGDAAACVETGPAGGEAGQPSPEGVLAGGGGAGAPAFSRPQAQSKGKTPGGARIVRGQGLRARDHSDRRRGANLHQARGTEKSEPRSGAEADQEAGAVDADASTAAAVAAPKPPSGGAVDGREKGKRQGDAMTGGEEVSGALVGSPAGTDGRAALAFGAPGLRSASAGGGEGLGPAIAIGVAALLAAGLGLGLERRRGTLT